MGHTDSAQHQFGVGSPQAIAALRLVDQQIGLLLERVGQLKLEDKIDIIVTCDHGFDYEPPADLLAPLRSSGLTPNDVVLDNEGGASLFYVKGRDPEKFARLVTNFQANPDTNAIFVASRLGQHGSPKNGDSQKEGPSCAPGAVKGFAPGTFALELIGLCHPSRRDPILSSPSNGTQREIRLACRVHNGFPANPPLPGILSRPHATAMAASIPMSRIPR